MIVPLSSATSMPSGADSMMPRNQASVARSSSCCAPERRGLLCELRRLSLRLGEQPLRLLVALEDLEAHRDDRQDAVEQRRFPCADTPQGRELDDAEQSVVEQQGPEDEARAATASPSPEPMRT